MKKKLPQEILERYKDLLEQNSTLKQISLILLVAFCVILILGFFTILFMSSKINKLEKRNFESCDIESYLETINQNCDTTFFTKMYGEEEWYLFGQDCNVNGYCKYDYIPLEKCEGMQ